MAVAMLLEWPGQTQEQYEQLMKLVGWKPIRPRVDSSTSPAPCPGGWRVVDIWESEEAFERFAGERPIPAVQQVGVPDMPNPEFYPIEGVWLAEWDVSRLLTTD
jgi:hypothetical protein